MAGDSNATKARLMDAAFSEFAEHGLAGARVDRIAASAGANKRLIYVYFGNKEQLFDLVIERCMAEGTEAVPFDVDNLPAYAGALFDHLVARPDLVRLVTWKQLERPGPVHPEAVASWEGKLDALGAAQERGHVDSALDPADILNLTLALAQAWFTAAGGLADTAQSPAPSAHSASSSAGGPESPARSRQRAAVVETVRRMTAPRAR
ncbi:TetR family transcriptional regulator [Streptomyces sp. NBC_00083]|uniref:TetR family transcriptional regulator n=1 Tax=Streptomyces sp. NBC_00083 TaxID=2975647 RepID=UPI00224CF88C|nr:TetR family transcriptional regulator [Streptomyces sp. NBC_00083]MCX5387252.1 TetR family transcriptional regulator [Streptomyces sp. NBC_00083]